MKTKDMTYHSITIFHHGADHKNKGLLDFPNRFQQMSKSKAALLSIANENTLLECPEAVTHTAACVDNKMAIAR